MKGERVYADIVYRQAELANNDTYAEIYLNHQRTANSLSLAMIRELVDALHVIKNSQPRFLLITGAGKNFCSGADLRWMHENKDIGRAQHASEARLIASLFRTLDSLEIPVLGVVNGSAFGGGVGLAACCDYVLATDTSTFTLSEARIGLVAAVIMPYLARKMPRTALMRACLTAATMTAAEAKEHGLVARCVRSDELDNAVGEEINQLLKCSPDAQKRTKRLLKRLEQENFSNHKTSIEALAEAQASEHALIGIDSFFAKSSPPWQTSCDYKRVHYN